ncbi:MAG: hypothetical protein Q4G62_05840 [Pseudomonadota bacterium]|nr:hypothetical protein [Pseudomonadota bacterium]
MTTRTVSYLLLALGSLPLLVYPFVLLAGVMSLAGHRSDDTPLLLIVITYAFLVSSIAYPAIYLWGLIMAVKNLGRGRSKAAVVMSAAPLWYLLAVIVLYFVWGAIG